MRSTTLLLVLLAAILLAAPATAHVSICAQNIPCIVLPHPTGGHLHIPGGPVDALLDAFDLLLGGSDASHTALG